MFKLPDEFNNLKSKNILPVSPIGHIEGNTVEIYNRLEEINKSIEATQKFEKERSESFPFYLMDYVDDNNLIEKVKTFSLNNPLYPRVIRNLENFDELFHQDNMKKFEEAFIKKMNKEKMLSEDHLPENQEKISSDKNEPFYFTKRPITDNSFIPPMPKGIPFSFNDSDSDEDKNEPFYFTKRSTNDDSFVPPMPKGIPFSFGNEDEINNEDIVNHTNQTSVSVESQEDEISSKLNNLEFEKELRNKRGKMVSSTIRSDGNIKTTYQAENDSVIVEREIDHDYRSLIFKLDIDTILGYNKVNNIINEKQIEEIINFFKENDIYYEQTSDSLFTNIHSSLTIRIYHLFMNNILKKDNWKTSQYIEQEFEGIDMKGLFLTINKNDKEIYFREYYTSVDILTKDDNHSCTVIISSVPFIFSDEYCENSKTKEKTGRKLYFGEMLNYKNGKIYKEVMEDFLNIKEILQLKIK